MSNNYKYLSNDKSEEDSENKSDIEIDCSRHFCNFLSDSEQAIYPSIQLLTKLSENEFIKFNSFTKTYFCEICICERNLQISINNNNLEIRSSSTQVPKLHLFSGWFNSFCWFKTFYSARQERISKIRHIISNTFSSDVIEYIILPYCC